MNRFHLPPRSRAYRGAGVPPHACRVAGTSGGEDILRNMTSDPSPGRLDASRAIECAERQGLSDLPDEFPDTQRFRRRRPQESSGPTERAQEPGYGGPSSGEALWRQQVSCLFHDWLCQIRSRISGSGTVCRYLHFLEAGGREGFPRNNCAGASRDPPPQAVSSAKRARGARKSSRPATGLGLYLRQSVPLPDKSRA